MDNLLCNFYKTFKLHGTIANLPGAAYPSLLARPIVVLTLKIVWLK